MSAWSVLREYLRHIGHQMGAIPVPWRKTSGNLPRARIRGPSVESKGLQVRAPGAWSVRSGHNLRAEVVVTNGSQESRVLNTNGVLQATVLDPDGHAVGRYAGFQTAPLVQYDIQPGRSERIPVLIGTASSGTGLGYALPPGRWQVVVWLPLPGGEPLPSPPLPLDIEP